MWAIMQKLRIKAVSTMEKQYTKREVFTRRGKTLKPGKGPAV
jgi:hypothetical protein